MTSDPRFSFLLPTRNRAGLLEHALAAVLAQDGDDFEVVVSDNASSDCTAAVVGGCGDDRVRAVRTDRPLPVVDNWERALEHARGEWVTILGDDDGPVPGLLERMRPVTTGESRGPRAVAWTKAWYIHPGVEPPWPRPGEENHLIVFPWTGSVEEVDAGDELRAFFARREKTVRPEMNAFVHRRVLDRVRREAGRVFRPPDPAVGLCATVLALERTYLAVDLPLVVMGLSAASISTAMAHDLAAVHQVVREYATDDLLTEVPLRARTVANVVAESLLAAKRALPAHFEGVDLEPVAYFVSCALDLRSRGVTDGDAWAKWTEWRVALAAEPRGVRVGVRRALAGHTAGAWARRAARRLPPVAAARRLVRGRLEGRSQFLVLDGRDEGFADLPGAACHLDARLPEPVAPRAEGVGVP